MRQISCATSGARPSVASSRMSRSGQERPADRNHLLLAAGELLAAVPGAFGEARKKFRAGPRSSTRSVHAAPDARPSEDRQPAATINRIKFHVLLPPLKPGVLGSGFPLLHQSIIPVLLAQLEALDLPRGGFRQIVDEFDPARILVRRQVIFHVSLDLCG